METISTAELFELALIFRTDAADQFQYWLSITFAIIAASFLGRDYLTNRLGVAVGTLYILATALFCIRYIESLVNARQLLVEIYARGANFALVDGSFGGSLAVYLRLALFVLGTIAALWYLYENTRDNRNRD